MLMSRFRAKGLYWPQAAWEMAGPANILLGTEADGLAIDAITAAPNLVIRSTVDGTDAFDGDPATKLTVTRASNNATHFDTSGLLVTVNANILRYDRTIGTGALNGILVEPARTNVCLHSRDASNAAWVTSNITAAKDQIGLTGDAASASSITATAGNGTILQTITSASASRMVSAWVKRITGSGNIDMTCDNGSTWTTVTVTGSWSRVMIPIQTVTNPVVGFRIVTSGDAIAFDAFQCEVSAASGAPTMPIHTTTASVTRNADIITIASSLFPLSATAGSMKIKGTMVLIGANENLATISDGTADNIARLRIASSGQLTFNIASATTTVAAVAPAPLVASGVTFDAAGGYALNEVDAHVDGTLGTQDTSAAVPVTPNVLNLGSSETGTQPGLFTIKKFLYLPRKMTPTTLDDLL